MNADERIRTVVVDEHEHIARLVATDGYLAKLKARGYAVEEPESVKE